MEEFMEKVKRKERESNFELLRIISMFMIVLWHVLCTMGGYDKTTGTLRFIFILIMCIIVVHVNSFVLVTGYFSTKKTSTWKKAISLIGQMWFYKIVLALITFFLTDEMTVFQFVQELTPLDLIRNYWFIDVYILLLFFIPYINILISKISQKQYRQLLVISFVLLSVLPFITSQAMVAHNGYDIVQFIFLYLIGAYLMKYPIEKNEHFKNVSKNKIQIFTILIFVLCVFFQVALYYLSLDLLETTSPFLKDAGEALNSGRLLIGIFTYNSPLVMIQSVAYFMFFRTLTIKSRVINYVAGLTFGVYLLHENFYFRNFFMYEPFDVGPYMDGKFMVVYVLFTALVIFVGCLVVEAIRKLLAKICKYIKPLQSTKKKAIDYIEAV